MKTFYTEWQNIPREDWPAPGEIYICHDPQQRLGFITWSVSRMGDGDGTLESNTEQLGLFWKKEYAQDFAAAVNQKRR